MSAARIACALVALLAFAALANANILYRAERDSSNDVVPGVNLKSTGRRIPNQIVTKPTRDGFRAGRQSACVELENLSEKDQAVCANLLRAGEFREQKHAKVQAKLAAKLKGPTPTPHPNPTVQPTLPPPPAGYLVNAQWDGRTFPDVEWALQVTRQKTLFSFNSTDFEYQYENLIPTTEGNASSPTYTTYNPLTRNYFLITRRNDFSARMFGLTVAPNMNYTTATFPMTIFHFFSQAQQMVGLEVVMLDDAEIVLVFYADGTVQLVDPTTGNMKPFSNVLSSKSRQINAVTYRHSTRDIFLLSQNVDPTNPQNGVITFNYATRQSTEIIYNIPQFVDPTVESAFEMIWMPSLQNLLVFMTGNFDSLLYVNPFTGASSLAVFDLSEYHGSMGHLEFTVNSFLEDLDTTANAAIDLIGQQIYFQCSDVDPDSGDATTSLCSHPTPTPDIWGLAWDYVNVNVEPMTYGYAGAEFVQIEN